jgi:hypothetical protein
MTTKKTTSKSTRKTAKTATPKTRKQTAKKTAPKRTAKQPASADQLRRSFKGRELIIDVIDGQYVFDGTTYSSLSAVARHITGYQISGPVFFRMTMPKPGALTEGK